MFQRPTQTLAFTRTRQLRVLLMNRPPLRGLSPARTHTVRVALLTFLLQPLSFLKCVSILTWNLGRKEHCWKEWKKKTGKMRKRESESDYVVCLVSLEQSRWNYTGLSWHVRILTVYSVVKNKHQRMEKEKYAEKKNKSVRSQLATGAFQSTRCGGVLKGSWHEN